MTLVEVSVVMVLAALVVMGLISFYVSSQTLWMRGSAQALAQRDATLIAETLADSVRACSEAVVYDSPDSLHQGVVLYEHGIERCRFWWNERDARVHHGPRYLPAAHGWHVVADAGPVVPSLVARFQLVSTPANVQIRLLTVRSAEGELVRMTGAAALNNRSTP